jgi:hypothetical protein
MRDGLRKTKGLKKTKGKNKRKVWGRSEGEKTMRIGKDIFSLTSL